MKKKYKFYKEDKYVIKQYNLGDKIWYLDGEIHREDGPAFEGSDDLKYWYLNNKHYSKENWKKEMRKRKLKELGI